MPVEQNFIAYQESISQELQATQDRVRNLIGSVHWQTDGEHKESVLRKVLRTHLPESLNVAKGFVCYPAHNNLNQNPEESLPASSRQIDILITSKSKPTLYKDDPVVIVTADAVQAIIEVKTKLQHGGNRNVNLQNVIKKLSDEAAYLRKNQGTAKSCFVGLFVFDAGDITPKSLLRALSKACGEDQKKAIDCVSLGTEIFIRYWQDGSVVNSPINGTVWHSYRLRNLAQTYFIGNIISHANPSMPYESTHAWFPVEGTKETKREFYIESIRASLSL